VAGVPVVAGSAHVVARVLASGLGRTLPAHVVASVLIDWLRPSRFLEVLGPLVGVLLVMGVVIHAV
jgi:hypothetical protein